MFLLSSYLLTFSSKRIATVIAIFIFLSFSFLSKSQIPAGYYSTITNQTHASLQTALHDIIDNHTVKSYDYLWTAFQTTDDRANGKVWDMYSNCVYTFVTDQCSSYSNECDCYNREHSFPKSWFNEGTPMYSDLFHLYPTDGYVNGMRSNYPYGEVSSPTYTSGNGSKVGPNTFPGYSGTVFEPIDEYKGDFARTYFYMAVRYSDVISTWHSYDTDAEAALDGTTYPAYESWFITMLMQWNEQDPVSPKETDRNNAVYNIQHNRNPFIDHPEYASMLWPQFAPFETEPTNNASNLSAHCITLHWTDASGAIVPEAYLIRMSSVGFSSITAPTDGVAVADDVSNKNVDYGVQTCVFSGLTQNTTYYFKIYSYTGSGSSIDYKTDASVQQVSITAK